MGKCNACFSNHRMFALIETKLLDILLQDNPRLSAEVPLVPNITDFWNSKSGTSDIF